MTASGAYLLKLDMLPTRGRSARQIVAQQGLDFEGLVAKFRPFFASHKNPEFLKRFDEEVAALRAGRRTVQ